MKTPREVLDQAMSEADFTRTVIDLARTLGWRCAHFRPARVIIKGKETYRTAVQGDGVGFPDLVLVKTGKPIFFIEVKSEMGKVSPEQALWLMLLDRGSTPAFVIRPSQWDELVALLKG